MTDVTYYKRNAQFTYLRFYDTFAGIDDFIEVTEWYNSEGFDAVLSGNSRDQRFSLTWGQYNALLRLVPPDMETCTKPLEARIEKTLEENQLKNSLVLAVHQAIGNKSDGGLREARAAIRAIAEWLENEGLWQAHSILMDEVDR